MRVSFFFSSDYNVYYDVMIIFRRDSHPKCMNNNKSWLFRLPAGSKREERHQALVTDRIVPGISHKMGLRQVEQCMAFLHFLPIFLHL